MPRVRPRPPRHTDAHGFHLPPTLHQAPKVRAAPVVKVCPSSLEQRERWAAAALVAGLSLSAWLAQAADEKIARG